MIPADVRPLIHQGDCLELLRQLPENTFQTCVTSPPYWRMRDYGVAGQDGLEDTVEEFVARQVDVFREVRRVLRKDGTAWVNIGDTYVGGGRGPTGKTSAIPDQVDLTQVPRVRQTKPKSGIGLYDDPNSSGTWAVPPANRTGNLKRKDLALVPFRLAIALQDDGWWVREAIIWSKPNGIPEPARGRPVHAHEYILLLAKSEKYFYDGFAVRQPASEPTIRRMAAFTENDEHFDPARHKHQDGIQSPMAVLESASKKFDGMANLRSVWTVAMEPFAGEHFAPYPTEIPRRAILAGTSARGACAECGAPWRRRVEAEGGMIGTDWFPDKGLGQGRNQGIDTGGLKSGRIRPDSTGWRDPPAGYRQVDAGWEPGCDHGAPVVPCLVLDPYSGSGTTLQVARELGRRSVGLELNPKYVEIARRRSTADTPDLTAWEAPA